MMAKNANWWVFNTQGDESPIAYARIMNNVPPFRALSRTRGKNFVLNPKYKGDAHAIDLINAALYLKRPLLVRGLTGIGKSSLADAIAYQLDLPLLCWPITSHSTLKEGLYDYDIVGYVADKMQTNPVNKSAKSSTRSAKSKPIEDFLNLRELGTALANQSTRPIVLLIDEIDKGDMDFPNSLLHVLEEGYFDIPELVREGNKTVKVSTSFSRDHGDDGDDRSVQQKNLIRQNRVVQVEDGKITCKPELFPIVIMTSNGEREFPPPFLRRCIQLDFQPPDDNKLFEILERHFDELSYKSKVSIRSDHRIYDLIQNFLENREPHQLSTDALLNAVYIYLCFPNIDEHTLQEIVLNRTESQEQE
ncbi:MoxR family ATPase [bacterium]|nr:MoxR family ATPase [bacterium]